PLIVEAWKTLYRDTDYSQFEFLLSYSGRFKAYNAHVKYKKNVYHFYLSSNWQPVDTIIQQGLIESLLIKVFKFPVNTHNNIFLYEQFLKNLRKHEQKFFDT